VRQPRRRWRPPRQRSPCSCFRPPRRCRLGAGIPDTSGGSPAVQAESWPSGLRDERGVVRRRDRAWGCSGHSCPALFAPHQHRHRRQHGAGPRAGRPGPGTPPRASDAAKLRRRSWAIKRVAAMAGDPVPTAVRDAGPRHQRCPAGNAGLAGRQQSSTAPARDGGDFCAPTTYSASCYAASLEANARLVPYPPIARPGSGSHLTIDC
jgi:hypothetical protein